MMRTRLLDPAEGLRFVVDFAQRDLAEASKRQLAGVMLDVQHFTNRETPGHWAEKPAPDRVCSYRRFSSARAASLNCSSVAPPPSKAI